MRRQKDLTADWWEARTVPEPNSGCRLWTGPVCRLGYGRVWNGGKSPELVHRLAYEAAFGPFDPALKVCHRCDTPSCINPDHLFLGTQTENLRDMFAKGRANPRGKRITVASVARKKLASVAPGDSEKSVKVVELLHLMRTSATTAGWRRVTGVPEIRPTRAIVLWKRPLLETLKPSSEAASGYEPSRQWPHDAASGLISSPLDREGINA